MPRWLHNALRRIRAFAARGEVQFTVKSIGELTALPLEPIDAMDVLRTLTSADAFGRHLSVTGEWLHVFLPRVGDIVVYVKVALRHRCVVVSFHEDEGENGSP